MLDYAVPFLLGSVGGFFGAMWKFRGWVNGRFDKLEEKLDECKEKCGKRITDIEIELARREGKSYKED